jgi:complement component 1 Q subcomponent-binding protein
MLSPNNFDVEKKRLEQYAGPVFVNLDDELQAEMQNYIENRGINEQLANFVTEYIDTKEQKEYVQWLQSKSYDWHSHYQRIVLTHISH